MGREGARGRADHGPWLSRRGRSVTLLRHIREIFEGHRVDRIASAALVGALLDLEDAPWPNGAASRMISSLES